MPGLGPANVKPIVISDNRVIMIKLPKYEPILLNLAYSMYFAFKFYLEDQRPEDRLTESA
jgi:hypothetical protein